MKHILIVLPIYMGLAFSNIWAQDTLPLPSRSFQGGRPQVLTPNVSSSLLLQGDMEIGLTQGMFTQDRELIENRAPKPDTSYLQISQLFHFLQLNYGLSSYLNVGLDMEYRHVRVDSDPDVSPLAVFGKPDANSLVTRGLSAVGPRVRWVPFKGLPELSVQSAALFPTISDTLTQQSLGRDRLQWQNQLIFYQRIGGAYVFLQADASLFPANQRRLQTTYSFPLNVYLMAPIWRTRGFVFPKVYGLISVSSTSNYEYNQILDALERLSFDRRLTIGLSSRLTPSIDVTLIYLLPIAQDIGSVVASVVPGTDYGIGITLRYIYRSH